MTKRDRTSPDGLATTLLPPAIDDTDEFTPERAESLLNIVQRWLADTHAPDNVVWQEARKAVPLIRKFLASIGQAPEPWVPPNRKPPPRGPRIEEINTLAQAKARIRELERTVAGFYGEVADPLPDLPASDDDSLF